MPRSAHSEKSGPDSTQPNRYDHDLSRQQTDAASFRTQFSLEGFNPPESDHDEKPPPAYENTDSDLQIDQDGLNTSTRATDDGRINIRIDQLNRHLSQILTPALRQTAADVRDEPTPPLASDSTLPPSLNVIIQVVGSRGDVQPFIALGKVLKENYGHRVRLATHPNFHRFVEDHGLEFFNIGGDPARLMAYMVKNPALMPGIRTLVSGDIGERRRDVGDAMGMGLAEMPTETYKAARLGYKSSQGRSKASASNTSSDQASLNGENGDMKLPGTSSGTSIASSKLERKQSDRLHHTSAHAGKSLGRFTKALVQSHMDVAMGLTKGSNNVARLCGDDTVCPNYQAHDFSSGATTVGKGFGLGLYDGITGLVTQPLKGAQQAGVGGFFKGMGKGVGGMLTKPTAGAVGVLGYTMKGVHKGMQNLYRDNVESHVVASRTAQGDEDWRQSSETEKQDVIARWELAQKFLTKKHNLDDMMRDVLAAQQSATSGQSSVAAVDGHERASALAGRISPITVASVSRTSSETIEAGKHDRSSFDEEQRSTEDTHDDSKMEEAMRLSMQSTSCSSENMLLGDDLREAIRRSLPPP
ncbi:hypothetical protein B0A48_09352 [Cryoendolithus antarcticus]|uniref:Glycosyltransferase family 28 N-terminal domain-containing protein n=1 Tax=Cryoendolithus antarcticus TaxID=1507870 RepID=A0A1V8T339_9PEZI|nr:hypothetical protein B0A48_09352 [Cryoendolithus antarcticus]